jgi:hypothetical protein
MPPANDREALAGRLRELADVQAKPELPARFTQFLSQLSLFELFAYWFDLVIPVLRDTLREYTAGTEPLEVEQDPLDAHIRVWNFIGELAISNGRPTFARDLFTTLLQELRALQPSRGRIHKGTPYHQIGKSILVDGDIAGAREYFIFAAIEDLITDRGNAADLNSPASQTLQIQYGETRSFFEQLAVRLRELLSDTSREAALKLQNPELLFIDPVRVGTISQSSSEN